MKKKVVKIGEKDLGIIFTLEERERCGIVENDPLDLDLLEQEIQILHTKKKAKVKIINYFYEPTCPISLVFTDKELIDWEKLGVSIRYDSTGYITN